jgi:hypothetical protein
VDADVSKQHGASTFMVEMYRFTNRPGSRDPKREGKDRNLVQVNGKKWTKKDPYNGIVRKIRSFQGSTVFKKKVENSNSNFNIRVKGKGKASLCLTN